MDPAQFADPLAKRLVAIEADRGILENPDMGKHNRKNADFRRAG